MPDAFRVVRAETEELNAVVWPAGTIASGRLV